MTPFIIVLILSAAWIVRIGINVLSYITLWYLKEYRPDRMMIHLMKTNQGKWIYFPQWRIPPLKIKTFALFASLVACEVLLFVLLPFPILVRLFFMDLLLFPLSCIFVIFFRTPTVLFHTYRIKQARQMLAGHTWNDVIGITGSFGKTSTKEFLTTILSESYHVLKTAASKNSPIGIAEVVVSDLTNEQDLFVVEMGAYKKGEIAEMAELVHPTIGILTAINEQHQDLFGTIEHTMEAKYELLAGLVGKKIAVVNADNTYTHTLGEWAKRDECTVWFVTTDKKNHPEAEFWVDTIISDNESFAFKLHYKRETYSVRVTIRGEHFVINVALSIVAAYAVGMSLKDATQQASNIQTFGRVMQQSIGAKEEILINDTFNNNPDASIAALDYLAKYKKKKIFVFQPMIELGSFADSSHERVGKKAAEVCDEIIVANKNFYSAFIRGVQKVKPNMKVHVLQKQKAAAYITGIVEKGDAILFKGKEVEYIWRMLSKKSEIL